MRPVSGLDRPAVQWTFVAIAAVLIVVAAAEGVSLRRARAQAAAAESAAAQARLAQQEVETRLSREATARATLSREVSSRNAPSSDPGRPATLTLAPVERRSTSAPAGGMQAQPADRVLELRLKLPPGAAADGRYSTTLRDWSTGEVLWMRGGLTAVSTESGRAVVARILGEVLAPGSYEVTLALARSDHSVVDVAFYELAVGAASARGEQRP